LRQYKEKLSISTYDSKILVLGVQPLLSPNICLSNFCPWRPKDLKSLVYSVPIKNKATFPQHISHSRQTIRNLSGTLEIVRQFMLTLVDACIDWDGGY